MDHHKYRRQLGAGRHRPRLRPGERRWVDEHGFTWLHAFKRLRTRYEHRAGIPSGYSNWPVP